MSHREVLEHKMRLDGPAVRNILTAEALAVGCVPWTTGAHGMRNEILASKQKNGSMFL